MRTKSEAQLQAAVMQYLGYFYPKALAIHVPNEGKRNPRYVKASGITAGVSDVLVFETRYENDETKLGYGENYNGLALEMKIRPNKLTSKQADFLVKMATRNWVTKVCYSFDEAKEIIDWYLKK